MPSSPCLEAAQCFLQAGLSFLPIKADGSKAPADWLLPKDEKGSATWKPYQSQRPTEAEAARWFQTPLGIALIAGCISGNLEILDLDVSGLDAEFEQIAEDNGLLEIVQQLAKSRTPSGGAHYYYRLYEAPGRNRVLARDAQKHTKIETRGEGGYALVPPSPAACHPDRKAYVLERGDLAALPVLTREEQQALYALARALNDYTEPTQPSLAPTAARTPPTRTLQNGGLMPGEDYNERGEILSLLQSHGWRLASHSGGEVHLTRPGKTHGTSATFRNGCFYNFSSNAAPFEANESYSPFACYALLKHNGDFSAAASALYREGYGERIQAPVLVDLAPVRMAQQRRRDHPAETVLAEEESLSLEHPVTFEQYQHLFEQAWGYKRDGEIAGRLLVGAVFRLEVKNVPHGKKTEWIKQFLCDYDEYLIPQIRNWASIAKAYPELTQRAWRGEPIWQNDDFPKTWDGLRMLAARPPEVRKEYLQKRMSVPQMQKELREAGLMNTRPKKEPVGWDRPKAIGLQTSLADLLVEEAQRDGNEVVTAKVETVFGRRSAAQMPFIEDPEKERLAAENRLLKAQLAAMERRLQALEESQEKVSPDIEVNAIGGEEIGDGSNFTAPVKNEALESLFAVVSEEAKFHRSGEKCEEEQTALAAVRMADYLTPRPVAAPDPPATIEEACSVLPADMQEIAAAVLETLAHGGKTPAVPLVKELATRFHTTDVEITRVTRRMHQIGLLRSLDNDRGQGCYQRLFPARRSLYSLDPSVPPP